MKAPRTEKVANEIISFRDRDKIDASPKASFALARDAVNGEMAVNAGRGTLTIAAWRGAGREAVLSWKGADGKDETLTFLITDDTRIS